MTVISYNDETHMFNFVFLDFKTSFYSLILNKAFANKLKEILIDNSNFKTVLDMRK